MFVKPNRSLASVWLRTIAKVLAVTWVSTIASNGYAYGDAPIIEENLAYGEHPLQKLDFCRPSDSGNLPPVVVFIYGSGWQTPTPGKGYYRPEMLFFANKGIATVSINHRLAPNPTFPNQNDHWPAQWEDCILAVRWLVAHAAEKRFNAGYIGAFGRSSGGHLATLMATKPGENGKPVAKAAVGVVAPTDLTANDLPDKTIALLVNLFGGTKDQLGTVYQDASPAFHLSAASAPGSLMIFSGTKDRLVPLSQSINLLSLRSLQTRKNRITFVLGADHDVEGADREKVKTQAAEFFLEQLTPKKD